MANYAVEAYMHDFGDGDDEVVALRVTLNDNLLLNFQPGANHDDWPQLLAAIRENTDYTMAWPEGEVAVTISHSNGAITITITHIGEGANEVGGGSGASLCVCVPGAACEAAIVRAVELSRDDPDDA